MDCLELPFLDSICELNDPHALEMSGDDIDLLRFIESDELELPISLDVETWKPTLEHSPRHDTDSSDTEAFYLAASSPSNEASSDINLKPRVVTTGLPIISSDEMAVTSKPHSCSKGTSSSLSDMADSQSNQTQSTTVQQEETDKKPNKRKLPEIDWRSIQDPEERRKQRRLQKNRVTAARSRERKKEQWSDMEERYRSIEQENNALKAQIEAYRTVNDQLVQQLASLTRGTSAVGDGHLSEPAELFHLAKVHLSFDVRTRLLQLHQVYISLCVSVLSSMMPSKFNAKRSSPWCTIKLNVTSLSLLEAFLLCFQSSSLAVTVAGLQCI